MKLSALRRTRSVVTVDFLGYSPGVVFGTAFEDRSAPAAAEVVTEQMIDVLSVAGDPSHCIKKLKDHIKAGLHVLHAWNVDTNVDPDRTIRLIAKHLIPELT